MTRTLLLPCLLLAGCPPFIWGVPARQDPGPPADAQEEEEPRGDTGWLETAEPHDPEDPNEPQGEWKEPWGLVTFFQFAADHEAGLATGCLQDFGGDGGPADALIVFTDETGMPICSIQVLHHRQLPLSSLGDPDVHTGFYLELEDGLVVDDCEGQLDPDVWGWRVSDTFRNEVDLGVGLTGEVSPMVQDGLQAQVPPLEWEEEYAGNLVGARLFLNGEGIQDADHDLWYARGIRVIEGGAACEIQGRESEEGDPIPDYYPAEEILPPAPGEAGGGPPARAVYWIGVPAPLDAGVPLRFLLGL